MTVSMGEETKGVLRVIRLVTGVSRATSEAAKPDMGGQQKFLDRGDLEVPM